METDNKRPNAALINREWFDSACKVLNPEDLGRLLIAVVEYVLDGTEPERLKGTPSIVFTMVRSALDSDLAKYAERCARNAANAKSQRQRVAASGSDSQRVGATTTPTTTTTTTSTTTTTQSLSPDELRERERFEVFGYFWSTGSKAVAQESNAFWDYYESLGWKNNKGAPIVNKLACARQWRPQFETGTAPDGAPVWFRICKNSSIPDIMAFKIFAGAERTAAGVVVRLRCTAPFFESLKKCVPDLEKALQRAWKAQEIAFELIR